MRGRLPRLTIRLRLTLIYGVLFLLTGTALLGLTYATSATTHMEVSVAANGQVEITLGSPLAGGGSTTQVAPFGGSAADLPAVIRAVVAGQHDAQQRYYLLLSLIALAILSATSLVVGWVVAGRVLSPVRRMTAAARSITSSNLGGRVADAGPDDELKDLGDTIDDLLARLERSFEAQRQFVANASHELRTPLARERALVQYALGDPEPTLEEWRIAFERVLVAGQQQERLLEALFTLAKGERGLDRRVPVDLATVAESALHARPGDLEHRGLHVDSHLGPAAVRGDAQLLERLVANLVDNAIHYNVPNGRIEVATGSRDGQAILLVANTGPSIRPAELDRLFEPFQRLAPDRTTHAEGLGLGLSIVRAVATAHDGTVRARAGESGGLEIEVAIPAAPA
jgi:signal transduction histidine kinase